ncbi:MAG: alpha-D-ribose 1-methylphosphonate 5-triphosphate diphosphatase [Rhodospirillales bacterium]|nr:MAG: alpha-D-ribose 1-methylphosphonate 5-triphosphate diphosphatase [Rhodospirillales bacterium]
MDGELSLIERHDARTRAPEPDVVLSNARIVTPDEVISGSVLIRRGRIVAVDPLGIGSRRGIDVEGDYLIPGMVELHTDNLERHAQPRPGVQWPVDAALVAHDRQLLACGVTTVCDAISAGDVVWDDGRSHQFRSLVRAVRNARRGGRLLADHYLHIRCEVSCREMPALFASCADEPLVRLVSVMDHTPGQRQFADIEHYRARYRSPYRLDNAAMDRLIRCQQAARQAFAESHRRRIAADCRARNIPLASHDDATAEHVAEAADAGMVLAEFPTTLAAAKAARRHGMAILMGAPNIVLGRSHCGNVSARTCAERGLLDIVSSDYVPASLLQAVFQLHHEVGLDLPRAVHAATAEPAARLGFHDRGAIVAGSAADLVRVNARPGMIPVIRGVWLRGERVA